LDTEKLKHLLKKYNNQTATPEEKKVVEDWYEKVNGEAPVMTDADFLTRKESIFSQVKASIGQHNQKLGHRVKFKILRTHFSKAAIFIAILLAGAYFYWPKSKTTSSLTTTTPVKRELKPGGDNATLQLADGSIITLNEAADGQIASQEGIKVTKTKSGELVYTFSNRTNQSPSQSNTVSTPKGGQYHLILVDKSEVWLNANSSITFPTAFSGKDRKVKITGEVYFEVAKDKSKPFIVNTNQSEIKVLGTHFNINAYNDEEAEATTLLEGAVKVKRNNEEVVLKPGQQANINHHSQRINLKEIDNLDAVIAWKNGYFQFDRADLASVMRQISRWYDADVRYNGTFPVKEYTGKMPRKVEAAKLIEMLSFSGIHCTIKNNQITVNPK
jgi:ferric-dicitrate binding protein FerR (iron transport regulator)